MPIYDKTELSRRAKDLSVVRDTFEKVLRLCDILRFFDSSELFRDRLAFHRACIDDFTVFIVVGQKMQ